MHDNMAFKAFIFKISLELVNLGQIDQFTTEKHNIYQSQRYLESGLLIISTTEIPERM